MDRRTAIRLILVSGALLPCVACGDTEAPSPPEASIRADANTRTTESASNSNEVPAGAGVDEQSPPRVELRSSQGVIVLELDVENAPGTARNFLNHVNAGFYDRSMIHFVDAGKMIVGGRYAADGSKKPSAAPIRNEAHNGVSNRRGTIAMVRDADRIDSATTEFFINLVDDVQLDHRGDSPEEYGYCVFGQVISGLDVADQIAEAPTETKTIAGEQIESPAEPIVIESIRVVR